jgi:TfoX/Sxy family transcriptional regulator of competence genes
MAFDEKLAERIRKRLGKRKGVTEKKMFGGIAFLLNGNMCCGVHKTDMIIRLDPEQTEKKLSDRHTRPFDLTGRPMKGWLLVSAEGVATDTALGRWIDVATGFARSLPAK